MGPSKSGKSYTSLALATALAPSGKIAVIDTENGSASKYAGAGGFRFDTMHLTNHHPKSFIDAINEAVNGGYEVVIVDSLSHEWMGVGGCLEIVDQKTAQSRSSNSFTQWADVTPLHRQVFETINKAPIHVICTFRVKTEYTMVPVEEGSRKVKPVKVGLGPVTRDGAEYEFDILMDMDKGCGYIDHTSRCPQLQYVTVQYPGAELAKVIKAWLDGIEVPGAAPVKEERITKVSAPPKPDTAPADPRPGVPTEAAANAPKANVQIAQSSASNATPSTAAAPHSATTASQPQSTGTTTTDPKASAGASGQGDTSHSSAAAPAPSAGSATDPKSTGTTASADGSGTTQSAAAQNVGPEQMQQILQVGLNAGWGRQQISDFLCFAFSINPNQFQLGWKQWEIAVKILQRPENKNGQVTVDANGNPLKPEHRFPKVA